MQNCDYSPARDCSECELELCAYEIERRKDEDNGIQPE